MSKFDIEIITTEQRLVEVVDEIINNYKACGLDLETVHKDSNGNILDVIDPNRAHIVGGSLGIKYDDTRPSRGFYIPVAHKEIIKTEFLLVPIGQDPFKHTTKFSDNQLDVKVLVREFIRILESDVTVRGSHIKYDYTVLLNWSKRLFDKVIEFRCTTEDTVISGVLLHLKALSLKARSKYTLNRNQKTFNEVCPDPTKIEYVDIDTMSEYAAEDSINVNDLAIVDRQLFKKNPERDKSKYRIWRNLEGDNVAVLSNMQFNGFKIDVDHLNALTAEFEKDAVEIEDKLFKLTGKAINFNSSEQVARAFFEELKIWPKLEILDRTDKPIYKGSSEMLISANKYNLEDIRASDETPEIGKQVVDLILEAKQIKTLLTGFTTKLPTLCDEDSRIHCQLDQTFVRTGRLACKNPNLQQIPARSARGSRIRQAFIASPGWKLVGVDYSQMELRILAHMTKADLLINAYNNGLDIHQQTADQLGVTRSIGKTLNFGIVYGMGAKKLSRSLKITRERAQQLLDDYFEVLPEVRTYKERVEAYVNKHHYIKTISGRTRSFADEIRMGDYWLNAAGNTPIQGSAGDVIKIAQRRIYSWLRDNGLLQDTVRIILQVHDELIFEVREGHEQYILENVVRLMEDAVELVVPLKADGATGDSWAAIH